MAEKKTVNGKAVVEKKMANGKAAAAKKTAVRKAAAPKLAAQKVAKKPANRKEFVTPQFQDFTIRDAEGKLGDLRIKANGIAWKKKGHQTYKQVSLDVFAKLAEETGRDVKQ